MVRHGAVQQGAAGIPYKNPKVRGFEYPEQPRRRETLDRASGSFGVSCLAGEEIEPPTSRSRVHGWDNSSAGNDGVAIEIANANQRLWLTVLRDRERAFSEVRHLAPGAQRPSGISGEAGIRTLGRVSPTLVFKTSAIDRSATSPDTSPNEHPGNPLIGECGVHPLQAACSSVYQRSAPRQGGPVVPPAQRPPLHRPPSDIRLAGPRKLGLLWSHA